MSHFSSDAGNGATVSEGYALRDAYLPIHYHYYLVPWLMGIYVIMVAVLLLLIPKNKKHCLVILPISVIFSFTTVYFDVLGRIFGGMNSVL